MSSAAQAMYPNLASASEGRGQGKIPSPPLLGKIGMFWRNIRYVETLGWVIDPGCAMKADKTPPKNTMRFGGVGGVLSSTTGSSNEKLMRKSRWKLNKKWK